MKKFTLCLSLLLGMSGTVSAFAQGETANEAVTVQLRPATGIDGIANIATFSAPFATTLPAGITAYYVAATPADGKAQLTPLTGGVVPANTGVLLAGDAASATMSPADAAAEALPTNLLYGTAGTSKTIADGDNAYILTAPATATRYLNIHIEKGTTNSGCFFGLGAITLSNSEDASQTVTLTFERTGTTAGDVEVTAAGAEGTTISTSASLAEASHTFMATNQNNTAKILCPNANANTSPSINLLFELVNLPAGYTFDKVGLEIHALNSSGKYQQNNDAPVRQYNITVSQGTTTDASETLATYTDLEVAKGIGESQISVFKVHEADAATALEIETPEVGFYPAAVGTTLAANKAYLQLPAGESAAAFALSFNFDTTTGIGQAVDNAANANAPLFDLAGRRVVKAVKGNLYIQNGKKFIAR